MTWPWSKKVEEVPVTPFVPQPPIVLEPGECECGHGRCYHDGGVGECNCAINTDDDDKRLPKEEWGSCACKIYIRDDDDDDSDDEPEPIDPQLEELERMHKL